MSTPSNTLVLLGIEFSGTDEDKAVRVIQENNTDIEDGHIIADAVLVAFLRGNGFDKIADAYEKVEKWYA